VSFVIYNLLIGIIVIDYCSKFLIIRNGDTGTRWLATCRPLSSRYLTYYFYPSLFFAEVRWLFACAPVFRPCSEIEEKFDYSSQRSYTLKYRPTMSRVRSSTVFVLAFVVLTFLASVAQVSARIHTLPIHVSHLLWVSSFMILIPITIGIVVVSCDQNDDRRFIAFSTFGFYPGGLLEVEIMDFYLPPNSLQETVSKKHT